MREASLGSRVFSSGAGWWPLLQHCPPDLIETVFQKKWSKNNRLPYRFQSSVPFTNFPAPFRKPVKTVGLAPVDMVATDNFDGLRELLN
jgi:hypothetical protein